MKRVILALIMLAIASQVAWADGNPTAISEYTFTIQNNSGTSKTTCISTDTIRPGMDKICKYEATPIVGRPGSSECFIAIYDSATVSAVSELIGEDEKTSGNAAGERFNRPRKILNGIWLTQGAYTVAIVHFIKE